MPAGSTAAMLLSKASVLSAFSWIGYTCGRVDGSFSGVTCTVIGPPASECAGPEAVVAPKLDVHPVARNGKSPERSGSTAWKCSKLPATLPSFVSWKVKLPGPRPGLIPSAGLLLSNGFSDPGSSGFVTVETGAPAALRA